MSIDLPEEHLVLKQLEKEKFLSIGNKVLWRGGWGSGDPTLALIEKIEININPTTAIGEDVNKVEWELVDRSVVVTLDNNHWAYGDQLERYKPEPEIL